jgi:3-deoxy-manno-octulosonate cytidylyltransferase (CMP-KDO synthetase)|tara:strand:+ start:1780 stop:2538 length:759 start_codon:yes stop_codon:yes gene_type:complete
MRVIAVIPARMASSRFPGKPLVDICGKTMIEHVWRRVCLNANITSVYIATCDKEIRSAAEGFGARVIMTSDKHVRCMDRIAEACLKLKEEEKDFDIVLNVQGDEPLLNPVTLDLLIKSFCGDEFVTCVNLIETLDTKAEVENHNNVKVVFDQRDYALFFSRQPIPDGFRNKHYKQLGAYGLTKEAILKYPGMKQGPLEIAESDDMLRFVEHGIPVKVVLSPYKTDGVDTKNDYTKVCSLMEKDEIFEKYKSL